MALRINELMIGDWVYCEGQPTPDNVTIQSIHEDGVWFQGEKFEGAASYDRIFPIPLTPEILEKNGMKEFEHRNPWQGENLIKKWYHKSGDYYVSLYQVGREQSYTFGDGSRPTRICNIYYVHEMQHALRLCGIEKEIVL